MRTRPLRGAKLRTGKLGENMHKTQRPRDTGTARATDPEAHTPCKTGKVSPKATAIPGRREPGERLWGMGHRHGGDW